MFNVNNNTYTGIDELKANELFLTNYNISIVKKLSKFSNSNQKVLEFGAGLGTLSKLWQSHFGIKPECLEVDRTLISIIINRGFVCYDDINKIHTKYDLIFSSNVLEHIFDDVQALKSLNTLLYKDGYLALYLPAFMCLYSQIDFSLHHYRRYEKNELIHKLKQSNFIVKKIYYSDSIGFFLWFFFRKKSYSTNLSFFNRFSLIFFDKLIYPISCFLDFVIFHYFFGKNLVVIAQKVS